MHQVQIVAITNRRRCCNFFQDLKFIVDIQETCISNKLFLFFYMRKILTIILLLLTPIFCAAQVFSREVAQDMRTIFFCIVSSAENSSLDFKAQYAFIKDIDDGRGYTAGVIGFTSGTGDMLEVVKRYVALKPVNNPLQKYLPALEKVNGTPSHKGLGKKFVKAWKLAAKDNEMLMAQDSVLDAMYYNTALYYAEKDGLSTLGTFVYYDALVVHGPGDDEDSFGGIRQAALSSHRPPSLGGNETEWLSAFLSARTIIMKKEAAHEDLSRIIAQQKFLSEKNFGMTLPMQWEMYGDKFELKLKK